MEEEYALLQGIVNIFYIKHVFNRFVHTFQKLRESKIKGCALFSTSLSYVCVKDCSGIIIDIIVKNIGNTYINEKQTKNNVKWGLHSVPQNNNHHVFHLQMDINGQFSITMLNNQRVGMVQIFG